MSKKGGEEEVLINLTSQITSLQSRIKELEAENARLSSQLSNCRCLEAEETLNTSTARFGKISVETGKVNPRGDENTRKKTMQKISGSETRTINHHMKRHVALKVMYFGQRFYGFSSEGQMDPTVESEIFKALERTRLLIGDKKEVKYSRCGRTDRGVSAVGQVIALFLRSKLRDVDAINNNSWEVPKEHHGEIDYVKVLNRVLPNDIRIIGWCPVPKDFSARFSCLSREYKYYFWRDNLNLLAMESAGKKFIGEHNFSNFCKMDAVNVHNYMRHVTSLEISPSDMRYDGNQLCAIKIRGSAFLWHQVRCMVAVLFMIGQGLESPDVGTMLKGTLPACSYLKDARQALRTHLENKCRQYLIEAAIFHEALSCFPLSNDRDEKIKKKTPHVPLMLRPTEPSYEERRKHEVKQLLTCQAEDGFDNQYRFHYVLCFLMISGGTGSPR